MKKSMIMFPFAAMTIFGMSSISALAAEEEAVIITNDDAQTMTITADIPNNGITEEAAVQNWMEENGYVQVTETEALKDDAIWEYKVEGSFETTETTETFTYGYQALADSENEEAVAAARQEAMNAISGQVADQLEKLEENEYLEINGQNYTKESFDTVEGTLQEAVIQEFTSQGETWLEEGSVINFDQMSEDQITNMLDELKAQAMVSDYDWKNAKAKYNIKNTPTANDKNGSQVLNYPTRIDHVDLGIDNKLHIGEEVIECMILPGQGEAMVTITWSTDAKELMEGKGHVMKQSLNYIVQDDNTGLYEYEVHDGQKPAGAFFYKIEGYAVYDAVKDEAGTVKRFTSEKDANAYITLNGLEEASVLKVVGSAKQNNKGTYYWIFTNKAPLVAYGFSTQDSNTCANKYATGGYDLTLGDLTMVEGKVMTTGLGTYSWSLDVVKHTIERTSTLTITLESQVKEEPTGEENDEETIVGEEETNEPEETGNDEEASDDEVKEDTTVEEEGSDEEEADEPEESGFEEEASDDEVTEDTTVEEEGSDEETNEPEETNNNEEASDNEVTEDTTVEKRTDEEEADEPEETNNDDEVTEEMLVEEGTTKEEEEEAAEGIVKVAVEEANPAEMEEGGKVEMAEPEISAPAFGLAPIQVMAAEPDMTASAYTTVTRVNTAAGTQTGMTIMAALISAAGAFFSRKRKQ